MIHIHEIIDSSKTYRLPEFNTKPEATIRLQSGAVDIPPEIEYPWSPYERFKMFNNNKDIKTE